MAKGLIGKKVGMTRVFGDDGASIPVTVIEVGPCRVTQVKTDSREGYNAVQIGFDRVRAGLLTRPEVKHQKGEEKPFRVLREFRDAGEYEAGQELKADLFEPGEVVKVSGVTKGKGFQGAIKRHGFGGGRATHGSGFHRSPGSLNASAYPSRVFKGKKLPGQMGAVNRTAIRLRVVSVDPEQNLIFIRGSVPGPRQSYVRIEAM